MPYPPLKSETYHCQGGINSKISLYIAHEGDFLNLQNIDFRTVGALSSFAGSTLFTPIGSTSNITGIKDYSGQVFGTDYYNAFSASGSSFIPLIPYLYAGNTTATSFVSGSAIFGCNNYDFWTWKGSSQGWQFSLGKPYFATYGSPTGGASIGSGFSGTIVLYFSLVRKDGLVGPALAQTYSIIGFLNGMNADAPLGPNIYAGTNGTSVTPGLSYGSFGISGIQVWASYNGSVPLGYTQLLGVTTGGRPGVSLPLGFTSLGWAVSSPQPYDYQGSFLYGIGSTQGGIGGNFVDRTGVQHAPTFGAGGIDQSIAASPWQGNYNPLLCEYFANQLFTANFAGFPSRVIYSNPGTPEVADYQNFFDVNPNDSQVISAMRAFFTQLMIWKNRSTYALSGTGPNTFVLSQISNIYGCLSSRAACVWNTHCWFLDEKGIFEFNGANVECISNKVQPIFDSMNVLAAAQTAIMIHVKSRNEIWCAIPINGSSVNNLIVVYDYLSQAWTTRTCPPGNFTALATIPGFYANETIFYGSSGFVGTFGSSLIGDQGIGITTVIKSRFIDDLGNSVTKMYRRLYVDASIPSGQTQTVAVNIYSDKSGTPSYQTTMYLGAFQNRIDFGVPAKSIAVEFIHTGCTFLQINGFTIEYRFQRAV